jgi:hypothetical protein
MRHYIPTNLYNVGSELTKAGPQISFSFARMCPEAVGENHAMLLSLCVVRGQLCGRQILRLLPKLLSTVILYGAQLCDAFVTCVDVQQCNALWPHQFNRRTVASC